MRGTLYIKKRSLTEWMIIFMVLIPFGFAALIEFLGFPSIVRYTTDAVWLCMLVTLVINKFKMPTRELHNINLLFVLFVLGTLIGFALNLYSPFYYLWGARNNFRFFVYFFYCAIFLKADTVENVLKWLDWLFYINFLIVLVQFFLLDKQMDYLGGIFGTEKGCNGKLILFLCIINSKSVLYYFSAKEKVSVFAIKCIISILIAVMAELKIYFVLLAFIVALGSSITRFSVKKVVIFSLVALCIFYGTVAMVALFPSWAGVFSLGRMLEVATSEGGYTGSGDLNRLTAIPTLWNGLLTSPIQKLFGYGLGNCDTSLFSFLRTPFFEKYEYLHYNWFSSAFMFIETGLTGFAMYLLFFIFVFVGAHKFEKSQKGNKEWCQLAKMMAIISVILIFYNASMRIEEAYMVYFILAFPFVRLKENKVVSSETQEAA